jgi:hypothetical protein
MANQEGEELITRAVLTIVTVVLLVFLRLAEDMIFQSSDGTLHVFSTLIVSAIAPLVLGRRQLTEIRAKYPYPILFIVSFVVLFVLQTAVLRYIACFSLGLINKISC